MRQDRSRKLVSVSKPLSERLDPGVQTPRLVLDGGAGEPAQTESRSARALLVHGKSEQPLPRVRPVGLHPRLLDVILTDERVRICDTELLPWRMICCLTLIGSNSFIGRGTGWLIGPRTVVTAGHALFNTTYFGGWVDRVEVAPGRDGDTKPFGEFVSERFSAAEPWIKEGSLDYDIGCVHLDDPIGDQVGWFATCALPERELENYLVNISGYPVDKGGEDQYFDRNRILHVTDHRIFYDLDTHAGQSGAPAFVYEEETGNPCVVGIHTYGLDETPSNLGITANSASRITPEILDLIREWIDTTPCQV